MLIRRPRPAPPAPVAQVAVAIIERSGRYLVCRRKPGTHLAGLWEFPGGKRRPGERWTECLHREVREELGLEVRIVARLDTIRFRYADRRLVLVPFHCVPVRGTLKPLASQELRWVAPGQLRRLAFPPANQALISLLAGLRPARRRAIYKVAMKGGKRG